MPATGQDLPPLTIRLLGDMAVWRGDHRVALPRSKKTRALLAYLALTTRPQRRERIIALLWDLPDDPKGALRWSLSKLRQVVDTPERKRLIADRDNVSLDTGDIDLDMDALRRAEEASQHLPDEQLEELVTAGTLLEGMKLLDCLEFEAWIAEERENVRKARVTLLKELIRRQADDPAKAVDYTRSLCELDPLDVDGRIMLIELLCRSGRAPEAERQVELARGMLANAGLSTAPLERAWAELATAAPASATAPASVSAPAPRPSETARNGGAEAPGLDEADPAVPTQPSVAVLPFETLSSDPDQEYFGDGLTHDIISRISGLRWLFVISRASAFTFRGPATDIQDVARKLGVRYVAHGSVRFAGDRLRLDAVLVDALSGNELWAQQYDRKLDDVFAIQDEIANAIVGTLELEIEQAEQRRALLDVPENLDAWSAYHRGLWHMYRYKKADFDQAEQYFNASIELDPTSPRPFAGLSFIHFQRAFLNLNDDYDGEIQQAIDFAERSLALDSRDALGHWALGRALLMCREYAQSIDQLETAIGFNPNFAGAHFSLSRSCFAAGESERGIEASDRARRLSPCDPQMFAMLSVRGNCLAQLGRYDEAVDWVSRAVAQRNAHHHILAIAAYCTGLAGREHLATGYMQRLLELRPDYTSDDFLRAFPLKRLEHIALVRKGLRVAGLPE